MAASSRITEQLRQERESFDEGLRQRRKVFDEQLRQERESFDHEKKRAEGWLRLQVVMAYTVTTLLVIVLAFSLYVIAHHESFPASAVAASSGACFVDVLGALIALCRGILPHASPGTELRPTIRPFL